MKTLNKLHNAIPLNSIGVEKKKNFYTHLMVSIFKGEKERYKHLNAEFLRITRRDKKAFFSDQCKEIEEKKQNGKD